ncbi:hypothetical protein QYE76_024755 [Lolium multiflorum]|uniref:Uncharacterized protein n=1 Tax=Lolium multiflorum TaxID=4521 RepID=A0AAD8RCQ2_LOLMU|nr:hypothetical protein QYE76_024755 [Lolium multiflorum]
MGLAAASLEGFPYRGFRIGGFATEALRRKGGVGGLTRAHTTGRRGPSLAAPPVVSHLVAPLRMLFGLLEVSSCIRNGPTKIIINRIIFIAVFHHNPFFSVLGPNIIAGHESKPKQVALNVS